MDFWKELTANKEMKNELLQILKTAEIHSEDEKIDAILAFAKEKGYEVFEEDAELAKAKVNNIELSDEDLRKISGGATREEMLQWCAADYLCTSVWNTCAASNECGNGLWMCKEAVARGSCNTGMVSTKGCSGIFWSEPLKEPR